MIESVLLRLLIIRSYRKRNPSIDWQIMEPKTRGEFLIGTIRVYVKVSDQDNSSLDEPDHTNIMWKI